MLEQGLRRSGEVKPGSWLSPRLESQECFARVSSESSRTLMDFRTFQPFLLHLCTVLLPPEMAPDLQETCWRSYLLADVKKWILHLIL